MNKSVRKFCHPPMSAYVNLTRRLVTGILTLSVFVGFVSNGASRKSSSSSTLGETAAARTLFRSTSVGEFKVVYAPVKNPAYGKLRQEFQQAQTFEKVLGVLDGQIALPRDVPVILRECRVPNAFYTPSKHAIVMCYELIEYFANSFNGKLKSQAQFEQAVAGTTVFVLFHEVGHALVGELGLPVTGKEEDAADEFSTLLLMQGNPIARKAPLSAAIWFYLEGAKRQHPEFWDEHSLGQQRFYSIVCLLYGGDPRQYAALAKQAFSNNTRLRKCQAEYRQKTSSWKALLASHFKKGV